MNLREKVIEGTQEGRLNIVQVSVGKDRSVQREIKQDITAKTGDSFNSRYMGLDQLCEMTDFDMDKAVDFSERYNIEGILPDIARLGIFVMSGDPGSGDVHRYRVGELVDEEVDGFSQVAIAKPIRNLPGERDLNYFREDSSGCSENDSRIKKDGSPIFESQIPPYPDNYRLPQYVLESRESGTDINGKINFPLLIDESSPKELDFGDTFNAILMASKSEYNDYRIFQFRPEGYLGYCKARDKFRQSDLPMLDSSALHPNLVYRFEITGIFPKKRGQIESIIYVRPLNVDFRSLDVNPDRVQEFFTGNSLLEGRNLSDTDKNVIYNMTHVNYKEK